MALMGTKVVTVRLTFRLLHMHIVFGNPHHKYLVPSHLLYLHR